MSERGFYKNGKAENHSYDNTFFFKNHFVISEHFFHQSWYSYQDKFS